jgi:hypothetical protein
VVFWQGHAPVTKWLLWVQAGRSIPHQRMPGIGATLPLTGAPAKDGCPSFADLAAAEVQIARIGLEAGVRPGVARPQGVC